jgi:hypothetical protein
MAGNDQPAASATFFLALADGISSLIADASLWAATEAAAGTAAARVLAGGGLF